MTGLKFRVYYLRHDFVLSQVSVERVMGCGLGGCYSCVVPVKHGGENANLVRSCLSGPVFDGAELVWE